MDVQTDGQNCDSNTVRCTTCSRTVKTLCEITTSGYLERLWRSWDDDDVLLWLSDQLWDSDCVSPGVLQRQQYNVSCHELRLNCVF